MKHPLNPLNLPDARYTVRTGVGHWYVETPGDYTTTDDQARATRHTIDAARVVVARHAANPFALWGWDIEEILSVV